MKNSNGWQIWLFIVSLSVVAIGIYYYRTQERWAEQDRTRERLTNAVEVSHSQYYKRYLMGEVTRIEGKRMVVVAIASEDGKWDHQLAEAVTAKLHDDKTKCISPLFSAEFISEGYFKKAAGGSMVELKQMDLDKSLDLIFFGQRQTQYEKDPSLENLITATVTLELNAVPMNLNFQGQGIKLTEAGAGFTKPAALAAAQERLASKIANDTNIFLKPSL